MKIPILYYLKFWSKNTLMAVSTGFVIGLLIGFIIPFIPIRSIDGMILSFILYQIAAYRYFWGSNRGYFEFKYIENTAEKKLIRLIIKHCGFTTYLRYFFDGLSNISSFQPDLCSELYNKNKTLDDNDIYLILLKLANFVQKEKNYSKEFELLNKAYAKKPEGFLVNYKLASAYEKTKSIDEAIKHYKLALSDKHFISRKLTLFIYDKILKLKTDNFLENI